MLQAADNEPPPEDSTKKKPAATPTPPPLEVATPPPPPATPAPEKPISVRKKPAKVAPVPEPPAPPPPPPPAPDAAADKQWEGELLDEEKDQLELAKLAEQHGGEKYKGFAAKTKTFLKELQERSDADGFDENDPEFQRWVEANMPKVSALDRERIISRSEIAASSKNGRPELEELQHELFVRDTEPKIVSEATQVRQKLNSTVFPKEITDAFQTKLDELKDEAKALQAVQKEYSLEFRIAKNIVELATADVQEFKRLTTYNPKTNRPLKAFDEHNPQHERVMKIVNDMCDDFRKVGVDQQRGDKWFATREEFYSMSPEERKKWWTLSNQELMDRALKFVPAVVDFAIKQERESREAEGFSRTRAPAPAAPAAPPTPTPPAPPRPSSIPSGSPGGAPPTMGASLARTLEGGE